MTAKEIHLRQPTEVAKFDSIQVAFMVSGAGRVTAPRQDSTVRLGDIVAIPPGLPRRVFPLRGMRFVSLHLHPRFVAEQVEWFTPSHPMTRLLKSTLSEVTEFHILRLSPSAVQTFASTLQSLTCPESQNYSWFFTMAHVAILFDYAGRLESTPARDCFRSRQTYTLVRKSAERSPSCRTTSSIIGASVTWPQKFCCLPPS